MNDDAMNLVDRIGRRIKLRDLHVTSLLVTLFLSGWVPPLVA